MNSSTSYPIAEVTSTGNAATAEAFEAFVLSPEGQNVLADFVRQTAGPTTPSNTYPWNPSQLRPASRPVSAVGALHAARLLGPRPRRCSYPR